LIFKKEKVIWR